MEFRKASTNHGAQEEIHLGGQHVLMLLEQKAVMSSAGRIRMGWAPRDYLKTNRFEACSLIFSRLLICIAEVI